MKNNNHITICGWMINELNLSGNELLCYALIYGFSQDGESFFSGSRKYISELIGAKSLNTVDKHIQALVDKKLIFKKTETHNGVITNHYQVNLEHPFFKDCATPSKNEYPPSKNEHNNIYNISNKEKQIEIDKSISKNKKKNVFNAREDLSYVERDFLNLWNEWLDYKDQIGKQYKTQRGAIMQYKSFMKYCENSEILARAIICRSIEQSWDGLFALTDKQKEFFMSPNSPYMEQVEKEHHKIKDGIVNEKGEVWSEQLQKWLK